MNERLRVAGRRGGILAVVAVAAGIAVRHNHRADAPAGASDGSAAIARNESPNRSSLEIPAYPNVEPQPHIAGNDDFQVASADLVTNDSLQRVFSYYRDRLPAWKVSKRSDDDVRLQEPAPAAGATSRQLIVIQGKKDGTHIMLATVGTPASN